MGRRFRNVFGPSIRRLRIKAGLTQDALAARLQREGLSTMDRVTVAKIESQIRSIYDFEAVVLAKVLNVELQELPSLSYQEIKFSLSELIEGETES